MTMLALAFGMILAVQTTEKPTLQYYQQTFVIRCKTQVTRIPLLDPKPKMPLFVAFRRNDNYAVWDDRGLSARHKNRVIHSKLADIATSPKQQSHDDLVDSIAKIKSGERSKDASGISGAMRVGSEAYFLVRWDDKSGKPWLEALVSVDLGAKKPIPKWVGKFHGLSSGSRPIDDKLQVVGGKLAIVSHNADEWGLSTYDPAAKQFEFHPTGAKLEKYEPLNSIQGLFIETSSYGTTIAGRVDLVSGTRKILYEGREQVRYVDLKDPLIVLGTAGKKTKLVNCETGATRVLPYLLDAKRAGNDILLWTPANTPTAAWLLSPKDWEADARWRIQ